MNPCLRLQGRVQMASILVKILLINPRVTKAMTQFIRTSASTLSPFLSNLKIQLLLSSFSPELDPKEVEGSPAILSRYIALISNNGI